MRPIRTRAVLLSLALVVAVTACEVSSEGPRDRPEGTHAMMPASEVDSIARSVREAAAAALASGPQAATTMPELYTPDAVLSDESEVTHAGHAQIARAFAQGTPPGATIDIRSSGAIGSGDLVVDMGNYRFSMPNPQGGAAITMNGRYLVVLQRMNDDSWKIVRQLTDVVGIGGAMPSGPPPASDSAAPTRGTATPTPPSPAETGYTNR